MSVLEGHTAYQQSQVAEQKSAQDQALVDGVEYVDTSKYEQYEKQEGDFVEGEVPVEAPEAAEPAEPATVPPDADHTNLTALARFKRPGAFVTTMRRAVL